MIAIHELEGHASDELLRRIALTVSVEAPVNERKAALMSGALSGALTGLGVDIAHAGLTLGAGVITGAVVGALGGAGIARGVNMARGRRGTTLRWDDSFLCELVVSSLLRYLAVAHYGRGRGQWRETEYPAFWPPLVSRAVATARTALVATWSGREGSRERAVAGDGVAPGGLATSTVAIAARPLITEIARQLLDELYPGQPGRRS
ncbi:MAG: hypothetical protein CRU78_06710 [Candidatus Accumulibacter phosphatis]|uniref:DUF3482 domain-containing protein n=1 Tax=Candidatus Accumulibacter phosphatis TaxID=327160 RepID=A0A6A7RS18_9PROT|nr:hypothetical protein [Candidatus Accumulibacter phosphatis]